MMVYVEFSLLCGVLWPVLGVVQPVVGVFGLSETTGKRGDA